MAVYPDDPESAWHQGHEAGQRGKLKQILDQILSGYCMCDEWPCGGGRGKTRAARIKNPCDLRLAIAEDVEALPLLDPEGGPRRCILPPGKLGRTCRDIFSVDASWCEGCKQEGNE